MALIFADSFDYYGSDSGLKWTASNGSEIDLTGDNSRTGIGAVACQGIIAPQQSIPTYTNYFAGCGAKVEGLSEGGAPISFNFMGNLRVRILINASGGVTLQDQNSGDRASSVGGIISAGIYNYFEMHLHFIGGGVAVATVRINGATVLSNINCVVNTPEFTDTITMVGQGGGFTMWVDDLYVCDDTGSFCNTFLGPVKIYPSLPVADSTPLLWTPSTGSTHFNLVNEVPPNAGATFVADATVGHIDQYVYNVPAVSVPHFQITGVGVSLLAELDSAGARSIGAQIVGQATSGNALTTTYHIQYFPLSSNPATGVAWNPADFPATTIGPVVTA